MDSGTRARCAPAIVAGDRLVWRAGRGWVDLVSNETVTIVDATDDRLSTIDWQARCAALVGLWHSHLVPLIDYFVHRTDSGSRRLEVYPLVQPVARKNVPAWIWCAVEQFLKHRGLTFGGQEWDRAVRLGARVAVLPGLSTGHGADGRNRESSGEGQESSASPRWLTSAARSVHRAVGIGLRWPEWLDGLLHGIDSDPAGPRAVSIHGPPGSGVSTCLAMLARELRRRGIVPLSAALLRHAGIASRLKGRTVALFVEDRSAGIARALAQLVRDDARVAAVVAVRLGLSRLGDLSLPLVSRSALAEGLCFFPPRPADEVQRAIERAGGLPGGVIVDWLGTGGHLASPERRSSYALSRSRETPWRVAEGPVAQAFALARPVRGLRDEGGPGSTRRSRAIDARASAFAVSMSAAAGSPAAWRALRDARIDAAKLALERLLDNAVDGNDEVVLQALWGLGVCALERAQPGEGERWLRAARCVVQIGENEAPGDSDALTLSLVRCLCWQGRLNDARALLADACLVSSATWQTCRMRARVDAGLGRLSSAMTWLARAREAAGSDVRGQAAVHGDLALLHLRAGDGLGARAHLVEALHAARRARDRARWLRLSVIRLAAIARAGSPGDERTLRRVARRLFRRDVPPVVRLRAARALEDAGWDRRREVQEFVERWGEAALWPGPLGETAMVSDLQAVLEICRDTDEALPALERVCHCVRDRLGAAAVAIHGAPQERGRLALSGPARLAATDLAHRLLESGVAAAPAVADAGVEAGVPVTYAGRTIGAVVCRWTVDSAIDPAGTEALLVTAATALAPHVQGVLDGDRRCFERVEESLGLLGGGPSIVALRERVRRVALAPFHVLIEGESGSGKELVARALHAAGPRRHRRFFALNCAALTDDLVEAELFGHTRGAFTGATGERPGLFEEADGSTLFLDEVGELSPRAQAKLLRVIQDGEVRRVGENLARRVDARLIAATNRQLQEEAAAGRFRADLLYRLDVVRIVVPPLRERAEDVAVLARTFWREATRRLGSRATLHPDTLAALARYHWPGNVRELQNVVMALAVNARPRGMVLPSRLPGAIAAQADAEVALSLDAARRSFEQRFVRAALARAGHRPGRAARDLGLTRQGFRKLLMRLQIELIPREPGDDASAAASR